MITYNQVESTLDEQNVATTKRWRGVLFWQNLRILEKGNWWEKLFDVVKRDGEIAEFNLGKINDAIAKAFEATKKEYNDDIIGLLSLRV